VQAIRIAGGIKAISQTSKTIERDNVAMKPKQVSSRTIFQEIGKVRWTNNHSFEVRTPFTAKLLLSPNTEPDLGCPTQVIIDEVFVPVRSRRRGNASKAMEALCQLSDKYRFRLEGTPIGQGSLSWHEDFVDWVASFGFVTGASPYDASADDGAALYVLRLPKTPSRSGIPDVAEIS
jgi:hypothetical protein